MFVGKRAVERAVFIIAEHNAIGIEVIRGSRADGCIVPYEPFRFVPSLIRTGNLYLLRQCELKLRNT